MSFWTEIGCTMAPGVPSRRIAEFEESHHLHLPPDLREYISLCNGLSAFSEGRWDHEWLGSIEFRPLERWCALSNEHQLPLHFGPAISYFPFADFLSSSHEYAIRLTHDPAIAGPVIASGGPPAVIATSFSDFIVAYLEEPERVVNPW
jgi:hypothetical protein